METNAMQKNTAFRRVKYLTLMQIGDSVRDLRTGSKAKLAAKIAIKTLLAMVMVYSFTQKHETAAELSALEETVEQLSAENRELSVSLEKKDNLTLIEQLARNEYGMVGEEELQKRYLDMSGEDYVRALDVEEEDAGVFATILSAIGINFGNLSEYGK